MRLVSFVITKDMACPQESLQDVRWGIWQPEQGYILDVLRAEPGLPASLRLAVEQNDTYIRLREILIRHEQGHYANACIPLGDCHLRAPYTNPPRNILCSGINYKSHLDEVRRPSSKERELPEFPFIFTKPCTSIIGPEVAVESHASLTDAYDYEVELAVIIGKNGRDIPEDKALDYVFGYSIMNDLSARDLQRRTTQWYSGKCLDQSAPFGPCIVCRQDIGDPQNLAISCKINGEERQKSHTSLMLFTVAKLIHIVSQGATLLAGDIISTGTPSGVGLGFTPPKYLRSGDVMELEIEKIGVLRNTLQ